MPPRTFRMVLERWCFSGAWMFVLGAFPSFAALNPALPPSGNFDLSHWKLTLPVDSNGTNIGNAAEVQVAQMLTGYTNALYFYTASDGAMLFWCPVDGATTSGSTYPRSELREMLNPSSTGVNWVGFGTHILTAQCKVTQVASSKKVIIGQIHDFTGNAYPLLKLQYNNGNIEALYKFSPNSDTDTKYTVATGVALSNNISYQIKMVNGLLTTTVNGNTVGTNIFVTDPDWTNQTLYFKAGNYCQDNVGSAPEGASVSFYGLTAAHATNAPAITNQPASLTVRSGSNATFSVGASGTPLLYRWRLNDTNIVNATNAALTITNAQSTNAGSYTVVITNAAGAVTSSIATLLVGSAPVITNQPAGAGVLAGSNATFTVVAGGSLPLGYVWYFNSTNRLSLQTNSACLVTNVQPANAGAYSVAVSNAFGAVTSSPAPLAVYVAPVITNQPASQTVPLAGSVTLSVGASGNPVPAFQWRANSSPLAGRNTESLTLTNFQAADELSYDVMVSNVAGSVTSSMAKLYLDSPLRLANWTVEQTNCGFLGIGPRFGMFLVEASADLSNWTSVLATNSPSGLIPFSDVVSEPSRFYRMRIP